MNQFSHYIYKKVNAPFVKNLLIFIVLIVILIISGYVLTIGRNIKRNVVIKFNNKGLLVIILVEIIFKVLIATHLLNLDRTTYCKKAFEKVRQLIGFS